MIPKLISQSRTTEVNTTADSMLLAYQKQSWETDTYMVTIFTGLQTKSNELRTAINCSKTESNLDEKDIVRDEKVKALHYLILGSTHHPNTEVKVAALNLKAVFSKYGVKIIHESYTIESSLIESLLEDFLAPELQADIALVSGCTEVITSLQTDQNDFKTAHFAWEEEKAQNGLSQCSTDIKKEVISIINNKIVPHLKAMQQANNEVYGELAQTVAQIINDANQAKEKKRRKTLRRKQQLKNRRKQLFVSLPPADLESDSSIHLFSLLQIKKFTTRNPPITKRREQINKIKKGESFKTELSPFIL